MKNQNTHRIHTDAAQLDQQLQNCLFNLLHKPMNCWQLSPLASTAHLSKEALIKSLMERV